MSTGAVGAAMGAVGGGVITSCANRGVADNARTAAIAAEAGRMDRIFLVIAIDQPPTISIGLKHIVKCGTICFSISMN
jgi:hypothetical protein